MRSRCYNSKHPSFHHYGGRGIDVCEQWRNDFDRFFLDMGERPEGKSLDRIDNELGYFPENCRWATVKEQLNNQRRNRRLTLDGHTQTVSQWSDQLNVAQSTLHKRLKRMSVEKALKPGFLYEGDPLDLSHGTRRGYDFFGCRCNECKATHNKRMRDLRAKRNAKTLLEMM
jgi:hypothetical protein